MIIGTDTHIMIELTSYESSLLVDLLKILENVDQRLGRDHERLRMDLLFLVPKEKHI